MIYTVAVELGTLLDLARRCEQCASPSGAEQFTAAETDNSDVPPGTGFTPLNDSTWHLAGVFNDWNASLAGNAHDSIHRNYSTVKMRDQNGAGVRANGFDYEFRIEIPVVRIEINQHWPCSHRDNIVEISDKIVTAHDHLVSGTNLQRSQRQLDGKGPAAA